MPEFLEEVEELAGVPLAPGHDRCVLQYATDPQVAAEYDSYYGLQDLFIADTAPEARNTIK